METKVLAGFAEGAFPFTPDSDKNIECGTGIQYCLS